MNFSPRGDVCNKNTENEAFLRSKPSPGCDFHPFHLSNCHTLNHHNFFHVLILGGPGEGDTPNKTRHFTSRSARLLCAAVLMTSHPSCLEIHNGFTFFQQHGFQDEHAIQCPKMSRRQHLSSRGQPKHSKVRNTPRFLIVFPFYDYFWVAEVCDYNAYFCSCNKLQVPKTVKQIINT